MNTSRSRSAILVFLLGFGALTASAQEAQVEPVGVAVVTEQRLELEDLAPLYKQGKERNEEATKQKWRIFKINEHAFFLHGDPLKIDAIQGNIALVRDMRNLMHDPTGFSIDTLSPEAQTRLKNLIQSRTHSSLGLRVLDHAGTRFKFMPSLDMKVRVGEQTFPITMPAKTFYTFEESKAAADLAVFDPQYVSSPQERALREDAQRLDVSTLTELSVRFADDAPFTSTERAELTVMVISELVKLRKKAEETLRADYDSLNASFAAQLEQEWGKPLSEMKFEDLPEHIRMGMQQGLFLHFSRQGMSREEATRASQNITLNSMSVKGTLHFTYRHSTGAGRSVPSIDLSQIF